MDALAEKLDTKLRTWRPETAAQVRERITEMIELADDDALENLAERFRAEKDPEAVKCLGDELGRMVFGG